MREHTTRRFAIVVLLLCAASFGLRHRGTVYAASQRDQTGKNQLYIPAVYVRPAAVGDLQIVHMGLYQSVQNPANSVTLVAEKPAILRVYALGSSSSGRAIEATVTVTAQRGGATLGSLTSGLRAVPGQANADDLNSTVNFDLPPAWLSGQVTLTATIDQADRVSELSEGNNQRAATFTFHKLPPLDVTIVPIRYIHVPSGATYADAAHDPISDWLAASFPASRVNVSYHAPYTFIGDLRQGLEWDRLLKGLSALWQAEVGANTSRIFYGLIPTGQAGQSWFEGYGISGMGWVGGWRVSIGLDLGAQAGPTAGHEIGHNLGRWHAPCGDPSNVDPNYPYPNAIIGVHGVDTEEHLLLSPNQTHDMMSYCGPRWVSDYTYEGLVQEQLARGGRLAPIPTSPSGEALLLRATVDGDRVTALPAYQLEQALPTSEGDGSYQVQLLDAKGRVLAVHPATLLEAEEQGVSARMIIANVPAPAVEVAAVRFLEGEQVVAERVMNGATAVAPAMPASVEATAEGVVLDWGAASGPALVRFSIDGATWSVLASDVEGGRLEIASGTLPEGPIQFEVILADGGRVIPVSLQP